MYCFKCFHGGHLKHMIKWFKTNLKCLKCDCLCDFKNFLNYDQNNLSIDKKKFSSSPNTFNDKTKNIIKF